METLKDAAPVLPIQERQELFTVHGTVKLEGFDVINNQLDVLIEKARTLSELLATQQST